MVQDESGLPKLHIVGTWDEQLEVANVVNYQDASKFDTANAKLLWKKVSFCIISALFVIPIQNALPKGADKRYHFSDFTITLNEMENGIAPTDSRLRRDQRLMEDTKWDEANTEKQVHFNK